MKRRSFFSVLAAIVVVFLLTGIGGFYWLMRGSPLTFQGGPQSPAAAMFVSKQAPVMVSLLVNPDRLKAYGAMLAPPSERRQSRAQLEKLKTSLLANTGLDYQQDIEPWLGDEITLAVTNLDIDRAGENGRQTGYLMALATKDPNKSREFLQLFFSKRAIAGTNLQFEQYKGIKLIYEDQPVGGESSATETQNPPQSGLSQISVGPSKGSLAGAVVGDRFVLFANYPKVLRDAINNVQASELNLTTSSQYQQALTLLPPRRIGMTFLNLPSVAAWLGSETAQVYQSQIIALELNPQGLLAQTTFIAKPDQEISPSTPVLSRPVGALRRLPMATGLAISGSDLSQIQNTDVSQLWTQISEGLASSGYDALPRLLNQPLAKLQESWGINLPQDVFSWVQGEYALGLLPHAETASDWIFVAEKSEAAEQGISRLDAIASSQGLSISSLTLREQKISAWTKLSTDTTRSADPDGKSITLNAKVQGVHATVGNYEIFTTSVEAMDEALKASQVGSLADNPQFQASVAIIPQPNEGYLYLDWPASQGVLERQFPILKLFELIGKPFFSNLRSLTVSSYGSDTGVFKGGVFFQLIN